MEGKTLIGPGDLPEGEWAVIELFGHQTLVGRISEVERYGAKMLVVEPLFNGEMLPPVLHGGAAIYRLTPCSAAVAWQKHPRHVYQLPNAIAATLIPKQLPPDQLPLDIEGAEIEDEQKCRVCGCTDDTPCPEGCSWVEDDLCSACAETPAPPETPPPDIPF